MAPEQLSFADARPRGPRLFVLPDAARVEERLLVLARAGGIVAGRSACSIFELERELLRAARVAVAPPLTLQLVLRQAARESSQGPFFSVREQPGYARALGSLLATLSHGEVGPDALDGLGRARFLGHTLRAAREHLLRIGLCDPGLGLLRAVESIDQGGRLPLLLAEAVELDFDGIFDWTPLRVRMLAALARKLRVRVRLPLLGKPQLDQAMDPVLRALERLGDGPAPEVLLSNPTHGKLQPFLDRLFAETDEARAASTTAGAQRDSATERVELVSCASPHAQAREVARLCADRLRQGAAADAIAIAARSLPGEEIAAELDRAGIPFRARKGKPALSAAPVRLALSLYSLLESDFPREGLIELLSTRLLLLRREGERLPPQSLARALREAHVRTAADLETALATLAQRKAPMGAPAQPPAVGTRPDAPGPQPQARNDLAEVRQRAVRAVAEVRTLPEHATIREHGAALLELLRRFGLPQALRAAPAASGRAIARAADRALARDQAGLRALEDACSGLAKAAAQAGAAGERLPRSGYAQLLGSALGSATLAPSGARGGAVHLLKLPELLGRSFQHVFVVGLLEGELPAPPPLDALLSEDERRAVNASARRNVFKLPSLADETLLFQLALASATETIALLYPRADGDGRETLRSQFADEAERGLGVPFRYAQLSPIPTAADCATPSDLLARAALDAFAEPAFRVSPPPDAQAARALVSAISVSSLAPRLRRIARAAQAERERVRVFIKEMPPGRFSGQLSGAALEVARAAFAFAKDAPASVSRLEENANCSFRTLGHRLLHVERDETDDEEMGARERGDLLHRCLDRFYRSLEGPLRGTAEELQLLREVAAEAAEEFATEKHVGNSALWKLRRETLVPDLWELIESEVGEPLPVALEQPFGFDDHPDSWPPLEIPGGPEEAKVFVRGRIDRVDRRNGTLLAVDYKSSSLESLKRKLRPDALLAPEFQLAVYAALLQQRDPSAAVDAQYVSLKDAARTAPLSKAAKVDLDALLELDYERRLELHEKPNLANAVLAQAERMRAGTFEARPLTCDYCDLKPLCRLVSLPTDPEERPAVAELRWRGGLA
ncbi:MAG TPA: PD-(D/E)XK nuclease family protein [Myxococcales bacterium]|jgi:RecB family exonuclease